MNKIMNSKIMLILSFMLVFILIGYASATDEMGNETVSTSDGDVDVLSQEIVGSVDDKVSASEPMGDLVVNDTYKQDEKLSSNNDGTLSAQSDSDVLGDDSATFSQLMDELKNPSQYNTLKHQYYTYDNGYDHIYIEANDFVIDGCGAVIDMQGSELPVFEINGYNVTIKNLTIKNIKSYIYGAITIWGPGSIVTDCNFINNIATVEEQSYQSIHGAALWLDMGGTVTNCNFINNIVTSSSDSYSSACGGAVYFGEYGSGSVENCNFTNNQANDPEIYNSFGGAVYFQNTGAVTNCNFVNNTAFNGGAVFFNMEGTISNCNFVNNTAYNGGAVSFNFDNYLTGIVSNCNFTDNMAYYDSGAIRLYEGTISNCNFVNNTAEDESAVYCAGGTSTVSNCNFIDNKATGNWGSGALLIRDSGNVSNCNFVNNTSPIYSAVTIGVMGNLTNCNFVNNNNTANQFSPVYLERGTITTCYFADNSPSSESLGGCTVDSCIFKRNDYYCEYIYPPNLNVNDFTTVYKSGEKLTFDLTTNSGIPITNGNISIEVRFSNDDSLVGYYNCLSGEGWNVNLPGGSYYAIFRTEYKDFFRIIKTIEITIPDDDMYHINVTSLESYGETVNITAKSNIPNDLLYNGKLLFILPNGTEIVAHYAGNETWWAVYTFDKTGVYEINARYVGLNNIAVNKGTLNLSEPTYSILSSEIGSGGDIVLQFKHYIYDDGETINIAQSGVVDGRGAVIDMASSNIQAFLVTASGVTIKNLTIKNVNSAGGAIQFNEEGSVTNCNFINNSATSRGGVQLCLGVLVL